MLVLFVVSATKVNAIEDQDEGSFSFVVLGHVRGDNNGQKGVLFDELLTEIDDLKPDLIFLTGDMIWGDVHQPLADKEAVKKDWKRLDAALEKFGVPVYRVPGNHDIHDPVTRDIYFSRYGELPQAVTFHNSRFILLNSTFVPEGDRPVLHKPTRTKRLVTKQIDFIRKELSQRKHYEHVFLFMHHILWWPEQASWWQNVHPLLVESNVRAVISGDFGPMKFSHMSRDGIDYIQTSIENIPNLGILRDLESSRLLSQQFDNFLYVKVNGPDITIDVKTVGEMSHGKFSPQQFRAVNEYDKPYKVKLNRIWSILRRSTLFEALIVIVCGVFLLGVITGYMLKYLRIR
jgi:hypothetical protein